ncbi:MAG: histidine phosphatase family protein [Anaerolineae bacterium]|nr:histidine phosphatase family protein [Anaerolineae bacterium]
MAIPRSVCFVRHGQTDWNLSRRYMGRSNRTLTAYGARQAEVLARYFSARRIDVIVHTGLDRTEATARAIAGKRGTPLVCDLAWRETDHGDWEGLTYREVMQRYPDNARARFADAFNTAPQGGESLAAMSARVQAAWQQLGTQFPNQRIVIVTHAGPIQAMLCHLMSTPLDQHWRWCCDLGSITAVDCYPSTTILRYVNRR